MRKLQCKTNGLTSVPKCETSKWLDYFGTDEMPAAGFSVDLLEYCDEDGRFHFHYWAPEQGMIGRSLRFDTRNNDGKLGMVSIIIDAYKK